MTQVRMIQAVVDKQELMDNFPVIFKNPSMKNDQFLHHVTLFFGKPVEIELDEVASGIDKWAPEGSIVTIKIKQRVYSMTFGVDALTVDIVNDKGEHPNIPNKVLHITASFKPERKPVDSNILLTGDFPDKKIDVINPPLEVSAKIVHYK